MMFKLRLTSHKNLYLLCPPYPSERDVGMVERKLVMVRTRTAVFMIWECVIVSDSRSWSESVIY